MPYICLPGLPLTGQCEKCSSAAAFPASLVFPCSVFVCQRERDRVTVVYIEKWKWTDIYFFVFICGLIIFFLFLFLHRRQLMPFQLRKSHQFTFFNLGSIEALCLLLSYEANRREYKLRSYCVLLVASASKSHHPPLAPFFFHLRQSNPLWLSCVDDLFV